MSKQGPRVLVIDIELSPLLVWSWGLHEQNIALNQVHKDWHLMAVAAKWLDEDKIFYMDQRDKKDMSDDREMCEAVWKLLDEADIVVGQNSKSFDIKKLHARFAIHEMSAPSSYKHQDTLCMARKHFGFTSNKLEYLTSQLNTKYKKLDHGAFPGVSLWTQCLAGNNAAWKEMKIYNIHDVLSTEELYTILRKWDNTIDFSVYREDGKIVCVCGHDKFTKNGFDFQKLGKFQRYKCKKCNKETTSKINLLSKEQREALRKR